MRTRDRPPDKRTQTSLSAFQTEPLRVEDQTDVRWKKVIEQVKKKGEFINNSNKERRVSVAESGQGTLEFC